MIARIPDRSWPLVVIGAIAVGLSCLSLGRPELCVAALAAGGVAELISWRRLNRLWRAVARVAPQAGAPRSDAEVIEGIGATVKALGRRLEAIHPITRLPTREQLLSSMNEDLAKGTGEHLLGLLHLVEADALAAIDEADAQRALQTIGERLLDAAQDRHLVSHIDRATFAIWFRSPEALAELAAIRYVASQQVRLSASVLTPTLAWSYAAPPSDGDTSAQQLIARATAALTDRTERRSATASTADGLQERFTVEQDLARAIEEGQLSLVFQPVVNAREGRVLGAEALMRWTHPTLGAISPAKFIPIVERQQMSERFGLWALNAACREAARWRAEGLKGLRMAVNLSAQQVLDPELEIKIERTLQRHGLPFDALELELTETAAMADAGRTQRLFADLRGRGVGLAIDDFGAGYSSLSYLKNLPFTKLKIDREFVSGVDGEAGGRAICRALIELGRGLGLTVLAEGVETQAEVDTLSDLGCAVFQGYFYARPLQGDAFIDFARRPWPARSSLIASDAEVA